MSIKDLSLHLYKANKFNYNQDILVHQMIEDQCAKTPNEVAVIFNNEQLTYAELNQRANILAHKLIQQMKQSKNPHNNLMIGLYLSRGLEMIIGVLGVLKVGAAYVPLDPEYPIERVKLILKDINSVILISTSDLFNNISSLGVRVVNLDKLLSTNENNSNVNINLCPQSAIYAIYTSGSTGKPKGVINTHSSLINRLSWMQEEYNFSSDDSTLQKTPYTFDVSVWELVLPLISGGRLVFLNPDYHKDPKLIAEAIGKNKITRVHFVPSMLDVFLDYIGANPNENLKLASLKTVFCSGEGLSYRTVLNFKSKFPNISLENLYGPTETAIDVSYYNCADYSSELADSYVPIGKPIWNTSLYIIDQYMNIIPKGEVGELLIGGDGVGEGYINLPEISAQKFIPNPFNLIDEISLKTNKVLYKTGDLCKMLPDGNIQYIGRNDFQIKINGNRVELGEIETKLNQYNGIKKSVVTVKENKITKYKYIAAYYISDDIIEKSDILEYLKSSLPSYMVPSLLMKLGEFPLNLNGKTDVNALPILSEYSEFQPDHLSIEQKLCKLFAKKLNVNIVNPTDDYYSLGGNSITAIYLSNEIKKEFNLSISVLDILTNRRVKDICKVLKIANVAQEQMASDKATSIYNLEKQIFLHQLSLKDKNIYNEHFVIDVNEPLSQKFIHSLPLFLEANFKILNSNYAVIEGEFQRFENNQSIPLKFIDYSNLDKVKQTREFKENLYHEVNQIFDIANDKLIRLVIYKFSEGRYKLALIYFHSILDATSVINVILPAVHNFHSDVTVNSSEWESLDRFNKFNEKINSLYLQNMKYLNYWKGVFYTSEPTLLKDKTNSNMVNNKGSLLNFKIDGQVRRDLIEISKFLKVSLFDALLANFYLLLFRFTGNNSLIVRSVVDERIYFPEFENIIGCFINNVFLNISHDQSMKLEDLIKLTNSNNIKALQQIVSYECLLENFRAEVINLSWVGFVLEPFQNTRNWSQTQTTTCPSNIEQDLYFELDDKGTYIEGRVLYKEELYSDWFINSIVDSSLHETFLE